MNHTRPLRVVMVAAECKGLAKVGGLADVVQDLARSLLDSGVQVSILIPGYGSIRADSAHETSFDVPFGNRTWFTQILRTEVQGVPVYLVDQPAFFNGEYRDVYVDSKKLGRGPFEDDARRFAFFCRACAILLSTSNAFKNIDILHCHDWHTGFLHILCNLTSEYQNILNRTSSLFTIHNLDYQGIRPIQAGSYSELLSLESYYPDLFGEITSSTGFSNTIDNTYSDCINPMKSAILLSDYINTVSPSYASEITMSDDPARNFVGGRGLEGVLSTIRDQGRLAGFLNGIDYEEHDPHSLNPPYYEHEAFWKAKVEHKKQLLNTLKRRFLHPPIHSGHGKTADGWPDESFLVHNPLAVSVSRLAAQKVSLLCETLPDGTTTMDAISRVPMTTILLGTGPMESTLKEQVSAASGPFTYLMPLFDAELAQMLYVAGDLFLMPSDFEPCGISQLIAMRYGTLPVASRVGGLQDTIQDRRTGFLFNGTSRQEAAAAFLRTVVEAGNLYRGDKTTWYEMQKNAMSQRFTWPQSASQYIRIYYQLVENKEK